MARGRHRRSGGWLSWLRPSRRSSGPRGHVRGRHDTGPDPAVLGLRAELSTLEAEVVRLRVLGARHAGAAAAADARARDVQEQLGAARCELAALRTDLSALRDELVWAFAERKLEVDAAPVVDLRALDEGPVVATSA